MSIERPFPGGLQKTIIKGCANDGFSFFLRNGEPGFLAIVNSKGKVIEKGEALEQEIWNVAWHCFYNFWVAEGYLEVQSIPADPCEN